MGAKPQNSKHNSRKYVAQGAGKRLTRTHGAVLRAICVQGCYARPMKSFGQVLLARLRVRIVGVEVCKDGLALLPRIKQDKDVVGPNACVGGRNKEMGDGAGEVGGWCGCVVCVCVCVCVCV